MATKWTDYLADDVYRRLCECRSTKSDIVPLTQAKWTKIKSIQSDIKYGATKADALVLVLEHLDFNNQYFDLTKDEWDNILSQII